MTTRYTEAFPLPHGLLFHHFHDERHPVGQGSISADQLHDMISRIGRGNFLDAREWMERARTDRLGKDDLCLTFDDNLRCQYDVALPVLQNLGLTGFWFVYTSPFEGVVEKLELYRFFRSVRFTDFDHFFDSFLSHLEQSGEQPDVRQLITASTARDYLSEYPFYSETDRQFRYLRDIHFGTVRYNAVMDSMIAADGMDISDISRMLWMGDAELRDLQANGHIVGTHSHTHPTRIEMLGDEALRMEHERSHRLLADITGSAPKAMSHPCNLWDERTLDILADLDFEIGFAACLDTVRKSRFLHARHDHADVMSFLGMK